VPAICGHFCVWSGTIDEDEYDDYMDATWGEETPYSACNFENDALREQLRDSDGFEVQGCYRIIPAPVS
jgi:hypothetical protein